MAQDDEDVGLALGLATAAAAGASPTAAADRTNKPTAPHLFSPFAKSAAC
ncbi:Os10g0103700 [Oryza sativa Japonica Group]|uniref:Os10g0103700 protein n=1 Tax=Oryza sativa subsp. japonica TaxID=39947 RepID=A0A0P0XQY2_ORYSJ|nr:Os10g0103700 [Oryza sativa Japonica Group]